MKKRIVLLLMITLVSIFVPVSVFAEGSEGVETNSNETEVIEPNGTMTEMDEARELEPDDPVLKTNDLQEFEFLTDDDMIWITFDASTYDSARYKLFKQLGVGLAIRNRIGEIYTEGTSYEPINISIIAELQQYKNGGWQTIATYDNAEEDSKICSILKKRALTQGYSYQVVVEATAENGEISETVSITSKEQYCD